jgi:hypothetical protein
MILRQDLAALPFLLCGANDFVLAPAPSPAFLEHLRSQGFKDLPRFCRKIPEGVEQRPWGVAGPHLRRSNVAKYRKDVSVCTSVEEINRAVVMHEKVVIKSEFSASGQVGSISISPRIYA